MIGNNIKRLRKQLGYSQTKFASLLHVTQGAVSQWEIGATRPDTDQLIAISKLFDVSMDSLTEGPEDNKKMKPRKGNKKDYITIPVLGSIPAGIPFEAIEDILDWEDLPLEDTLPGRKYFGLRITVDSMEPEYRSGDTIIIQQQDHCNSGDDCAVMVNGDDATFKRVRLQENGLTLQPLNPKYDPRFFTTKEIQELPVRILGIVVEIRRNLRK